ncbi:BON domain-containing protein [Benzoatithermus flavus]|uniref:BON domain-containing protein n=1 Tax=Benzoatithermus flavus TaxID=3108223 RepID=A0ABU8XT17_9PROT
MAERASHGRPEEGGSSADPYRHQPDHRFYGYDDPGRERRYRDWQPEPPPGETYRRAFYSRYGFGLGDYAGRGVSRAAADAVTDYDGGEPGGQIHPEHHVRARGQRGRGPKGYRRSDERIREDVSDWLTDDAWIDASDIEVRVENGEVTLDGTVNSRRARRRAEDIAESVSGVSYVQNNLRVRQRQDRGRPPIYEGATSSSALGGLDAGMGSAGVSALSGSAAGSPAMGTTGGRSGAAPGVTSTTGIGYSTATGTNRNAGTGPGSSQEEGHLG